MALKRDFGIITALPWRNYNTSRMRALLSLLLLPLLSPNVRTVHVSPFKSYQNYEHFKRLTLHCEPAEVEFIQGFDYEWGYTYTLEVQERRFEEILSDGTQAEYTLERVVSKTPVAPGTSFTLYLEGQRYYHDDPEGATLKYVGGTTWRYFDEVEFEVPESLQSRVSAIAAGEAGANGRIGGNGRFTFDGPHSIRLVALK